MSESLTKAMLHEAYCGISQSLLGSPVSSEYELFILCFPDAITQSTSQQMLPPHDTFRTMQEELETSAMTGIPLFSILLHPAHCAPLPVSSFSSLLPCVFVFLGFHSSELSQ